MTGLFHAGMLQGAALLVPRELRADWLEEWTGELAYIRRESPRRAVGFCLGAFRDAFWMRRNAPASESRNALLESPLHCLLSLCGLAAAAIAIGWQLPGPRSVLEPVVRPNSGRLVMLSSPNGRLKPDQRRWLETHLPSEFYPGLVLDHGMVLARLKPGTPPHEGSRWQLSITRENGTLVKLDCTEFDLVRPFSVLLFLAALALPGLAGTTSLSIGVYTSMPSTRLRLWAFFGVKVLLAAAVLFFIVLDLGSATVMEIRPHGLIVGFAIAFRWAIKDQRRRCPVCLRRLTNPIRFGAPAHAFLEWYGTELICSEGHGMMHVPEIPTSSYPEPRWVSLDA